jgi:hypothetical protein
MNFDWTFYKAIVVLVVTGIITFGVLMFVSQGVVESYSIGVDWPSEQNCNKLNNISQYNVTDKGIAILKNYCFQNETGWHYNGTMYLDNVVS